MKAAMLSIFMLTLVLSTHHAVGRKNAKKCKKYEKGVEKYCPQEEYNALPHLPCPHIGFDINGNDCGACLPGNDQLACPCNNQCFQTLSWEECASQCNGVDHKEQPNGTSIYVGYIAWSWQSRAVGAYSLQCCCKNDFELSKNFPFTSPGTIMGTARCLGTGRTY